MKPKDYMEKVLQLENKDYKGIQHRLSRVFINRLLHAGMGITTESGEFLDMLKKHIFYGKELDTINLKEELGDLLFYIALAMDELGTTFEEVMKINFEKLSARYPNKFTKEDATNRDLDKEREILEQGYPELKDYQLPERKTFFDKDVGVWVVEALDYYLASQGKTKEEAINSFKIIVQGQIILDKEAGLVPLEQARKK